MSQGFTREIPISTDGTLAGNSDFVVVSEKAIKTYVDNAIATVAWDGNIPNTTQAGPYTLALSDVRQMLICTGGTVTVPPNVSVAFDVGDWMLIRRDGTTEVDIAEGAGVTIEAPDNWLRLFRDGAVAILIKTATDTWSLSGELTVTPDADTTTFYTATGILDYTTRQAVAHLVNDYKVAGLWSKRSAIWPHVGGYSTPCTYNLRDTTSYNLVFSGTWTFSGDGATNVNGYAQTGLVPNTVLTADDTSMGYYCGDNLAAAANTYLMGCSVSGGNPIWSIGWNGAITHTHYAYNTGNLVQPALNDHYGLFANVRTDGTTHKAFKRGVQVGATDAVASISGLPTTNLMLAAVNIHATTGYTPFGKTFHLCQGAFVGDGLTDAEMTTENFIWDKFQMRLNRNK